MTELRFNYYYSNESEQFNFYRIPKILFTDKRFSKLSVDAKVLYGLMLARMSLSAKNHWVYDGMRVYIFSHLMKQGNSWDMLRKSVLSCLRN